MEYENPPWDADETTAKCRKCSGTFGYFRWKHHCRYCGKIFCHWCSNNYSKKVPNYNTEVRICDDCNIIIKREQEIIISHKESLKNQNKPSQDLPNAQEATEQI